MKYAQNLAIPCLLFLAIWRMDLATDINWQLLLSFYSGSVFCFFIGMAGARFVFARPWEDAVVIGFAALFGNTVLLGLAVVGRAYGGQALAATFTIAAFHSLLSYSLGVAVYEILRDRSGSRGNVAGHIVHSLLRNALLVGLFVGLAFNLLKLELPSFATEALELVASSGIPAALFALGGILTRYRIEGDIGLVLMVCVLSLVIHPSITYTVSTWVFDLDIELVRGAVITAAMAPGVNAFIFASIYNRAMRVSASAVLLGTLASLFTASTWIAIVG